MEEDGEIPLKKTPRRIPRAEYDVLSTDVNFPVFHPETGEVTSFALLETHVGESVIIQGNERGRDVEWLALITGIKHNIGSQAGVIIGKHFQLQLYETPTSLRERLGLVRFAQVLQRSNRNRSTDFDAKYELFLSNTVQNNVSDEVIKAKMSEKFRVQLVKANLMHFHHHNHSAPRRRYLVKRPGQEPRAVSGNVKFKTLWIPGRLTPFHSKAPKK
ncbi:hypothetical protein CYMTET_51092 [Cymbomonas tetramitiformis]|uniref:Uncharacterized protein n=1 Tax=Cymbomonas tetramitiformis TaxID=36881 RepID=A0AAE0BNC4_9CHLO|nr:hypothetical protein CYMTET_51092 [Cymbomonas tetramitiformis]